MAQLSRPHTLFASGPRDQEVLMQQITAQPTAPVMTTYAAYTDPSMVANQWSVTQPAYYQNADGTIPMWNGSSGYGMTPTWPSNVQSIPLNMPPPPNMPPIPMHSMTQNHY